MTSLAMRRISLENLPEIEAFLAPNTRLRACRGETTQDRQRLLDLLKAAFDDENWTPERLDKELVRDLNVKTIFVIEEKELFVATASVLLAPDTMPDTGIVHWVGSHPDYRGRRLGYQATLATLWEFRRLGCKDALLRTHDHRLPAIRTYLRLGFVPESIQPSDAECWNAVFQEMGRSERPTLKGQAQ